MTTLIDISALHPECFIDIRYATDDNFTGKPVYSKAGCYLHPDAAEKLTKALRLAQAIGYNFRLFEAFRPHDAQIALWKHTPDENYLSHPETGSLPHCRGVAIDLTLTDGQGKDLDMGTEFDAFTPRSHHANTEISAEAQKNRFILMGIMTSAGWDNYMNEWWHYQLFSPRTYDVLTDIDAKTNMM